jgi:hypothetical protein
MFANNVNIECLGTTAEKLLDHPVLALAYNCKAKLNNVRKID